MKARDRIYSLDLVGADGEQNTIAALQSERGRRKILDRPKLGVFAEHYAEHRGENLAVDNSERRFRKEIELRPEPVEDRALAIRRDKGEPNLRELLYFADIDRDPRSLL